jgi:hypothetical protein
MISESKMPFGTTGWPLRSFLSEAIAVGDAHLLPPGLAR